MFRIVKKLVIYIYLLIYLHALCYYCFINTYIILSQQIKINTNTSAINHNYHARRKHDNVH